MTRLQRASARPQRLFGVELGDARRPAPRTASGAACAPAARGRGAQLAEQHRQRRRGVGDDEPAVRQQRRVGRAPERARPRRSCGCRAARRRASASSAQTGTPVSISAISSTSSSSPPREKAAPHHPLEHGRLDRRALRRRGRGRSGGRRRGRPTGRARGALPPRARRASGWTARAAAPRRRRRVAGQRPGARDLDLRCEQAQPGELLLDLARAPAGAPGSRGRAARRLVVARPGPRRGRRTSQRGRAARAQRRARRARRAAALLCTSPPG